MEYYSAIKKNEIMPSAATQVDLEITILIELSQTENDSTVWFHIYVESQKQNKWTNITKQKLSHRYREQRSGCQWEEV